MKARMTIAAALALVAVAVPAAGAAPAAHSHASVPWGPRLTHEDPIYRCVVQRGQHVVRASSLSKCGLIPRA